MHPKAISLGARIASYSAADRRRRAVLPTISRDSVVLAKGHRSLPARCGVCLADGVDLARWLVQGGFALDWPQYSRGAYSQDQATAAGKDSGSLPEAFSRPRKYRACIRAADRRPAFAGSA